MSVRMIVLLSLVALAAPSQAAQRTKARDNGALLEQKCEMVGKEMGEGEGRGGAGRLQAQRFSDCMMGTEH
jgi:hypothetical protein